MEVPVKSLKISAVFLSFFLLAHNVISAMGIEPFVKINQVSNNMGSPLILEIDNKKIFMIDLLLSL